MGGGGYSFLPESTEAFAQAANVARRAGVDGVEISIHHDYMLGSFCWTG
jgi:2,4-dienoyl-CoA reductase-like NADH-dependent reductase (Old Yellow Enzyme family)